MSVGRYIKIGLFFVGLGTAGVVYLVKAGDGFSPINTKMYEVVVDDATGLSTNSNVYLAGVPVGKIRAIDLTGNRAKLRVAFLKDVEIRNNARITKQPSSLLGTSRLAIFPGTEDAPALQAGGMISSAPASGDFSSTMNTVNAVGTQVQAMLDEFQKTHMQLLAATLESIKSVSAKVDERSTEELNRVSRILEASALVAERLEKVTRDREGDVAVSLAAARAALENIQAITQTIRGGQGNVGKVVNDEELYDRLLAIAQRTEEAADNLNQALVSINKLAVNADGVVSDAKDIVAKANGLGVQVDVNSAYRINSTTGSGAASLILVPRTQDRWYRFGITGAPMGVTSTTVTETDSGGSSSTKTEKVTKNGVYFDAELARKIGPVTVRGGMLESSAGIGLDYQPISVLGLSAELFDLRSGSAPNLQAYATLYPFFDPKGASWWNWIYLRGGVRNALDSDKRDFFIGGGVRFADEEVRGLVGLMPLAAK